MNKALKDELENLKKNLPKFKILIKQSGLDYLNSLSIKEMKMIIKKIKQGANNPKDIPFLKHNLKGYRKIKVGDHRAVVIIQFKPKGMDILYIGNRKSIYQEFERKL